MTLGMRSDQGRLSMAPGYDGEFRRKQADPGLIKVLLSLHGVIMDGDTIWQDYPSDNGTCRCLIELASLGNPDFSFTTSSSLYTILLHSHNQPSTCQLPACSHFHFDI